jgi:pyridoxine 5-phosphate synthase
VIRLSVNIDHVATVRQARRADEPDPVVAATQAELAGAGAIICHLREDRRHVQDRDLRLLRQVITTRLNLEMGLSDEIVRIAHEVRPHQVTFVPEKRQELTTEGGLDMAADRKRIAARTGEFRAEGVEVSHFIDPDETQIRAAREAGAQIVELHTGCYANAGGGAAQAELERLRTAARSAHALGLRVFGGHGLTYRNVAAVAAIPEFEELSIGHSIIARAVYVGIGPAVREMLDLLRQARA